MKRYKLKDLSMSKLEYGSGAAACEYDGNTRYVRITDIDSNGKLGDDIVSPNCIDEKYILNDGDVLFARTGATVGKTYRHHDNDGRCLYAGFLIRVTPNQEVIRPDYLYYFTKSPQYNSFVQSSMKVVAQPNINAKQYGELEFNVPELVVQDVIIEKLSKIVRVIDARKLELLKLDELIKARFVELFGDPFDTTKWLVKELRDISESMIDGSNVNPDYYENEGEVLFLRIQNVWRNEFRLDDSVYISQEINHNHYYETSLKTGDLLITKIGRYYTKDSSLGRVSLYRGEDDCANYSNNIMRVRLNNSVNSEFVNVLLNLDDYQSYIKRTSKGGTDKRALSKSLIGSYPIIIPPKRLQNEFVSFVVQVDKSKLIELHTLTKYQYIMN